MIINSASSCVSAKDIIDNLIDRSDMSGAITFVDSLCSSSDQKANLQNLRAWTYAEVGGYTQQVDLIEMGIAIWSSIADIGSPMISYNIASSKLNLWELHVTQSNLVTAWMQQRDSLHESRKLLIETGRNYQADNEHRLKALVDAGNSYDIVGRHFDALDCYNRALKIDPTFGMARGNRGLALFSAAPLMGTHTTDLLIESAHDLDAAIEDSESVLRYGGESALEQFKSKRAAIELDSDGSASRIRARSDLGDAYLNWCLNNELFLHGSLDYIRADTGTLDPIFFRQITTGLSAEDVSHTNEIIDGFNTLKQDYISARYALWLATSHESQIREHARLVTRRTSFLDTLRYARWGVRTGVGNLALRATVDILGML